jgi:hypothetical protein|tara:strand:+ start:711 stop:965 length:255 start_codon:yes stop_codon:yes gene_type:complete
MTDAEEEEWEEALEKAYEQAEHLVRALKDVGFDGCKIVWAEGFWALFVDEALLLTAYSDYCPMESIERLHSRVVDAFYRDPIKA